MAREKQVQITEKLLLEICQYFLLDQRTAELEKAIVKGLEDKIDRVVEHELYSKSMNTSLPEAEREAARKEYLDKKGISESFRWSADYQNARLKNE